MISFLGHFDLAVAPKKENLSSFDRFKRTAIQYLHEDYEKSAEIWNLVDLVFLPSPQKCMFVVSTHVVEMFSVHFPQYKIMELSRHTNTFRNRIIYFLALISKRRFTEYNDGIAVFINLIDPYILKAYRLLHPNKKIYLRFHDPIETTARKNMTPDKLSKIYRQLRQENIVQGVESYYEADAKLLGISYRPNAVNGDVMETVNYRFRNYLYTFIGTFKNRNDHSRLDDLEMIRIHLSELYPSASRYINECIMDGLTERIPYPKYLELVGLSEIVVDMYRSHPYEGFSYRIPEALLMERKVITNRLIVLECDFYDPSRFFVIGHDSIDRLKEFMENDFKPLSPELRKRYDCNNWWKSS